MQISTNTEKETCCSSDKDNSSSQQNDTTKHNHQLGHKHAPPDASALPTLVSILPTCLESDDSIPFPASSLSTSVSDSTSSFRREQQLNYFAQPFLLPGITKEECAKSASCFTTFDGSIASSSSASVKEHAFIVSQAYGELLLPRGPARIENSRQMTASKTLFSPKKAPLTVLISDGVDLSTSMTSPRRYSCNYNNNDECGLVVSEDSDCDYDTDSGTSSISINHLSSSSSPPSPLPMANTRYTNCKNFDSVMGDEIPGLSPGRNDDVFAFPFNSTTTTASFNATTCSKKRNIPLPKPRLQPRRTKMVADINGTGFDSEDYHNEHHQHELISDRTSSDDFPPPLMPLL